MNVILVLLIFMFSILFLLISHLIFEKHAIKNIYIFYNIVSYLLSFKIVEIMKININANIFISTLFMILTYIIIEKVSVKDFKTLIKKIFFINILISILLFISSLYMGSITDNNWINIRDVFIYNYKIIICYPIITFIVQLLSSLIYPGFKVMSNKISIRIILTSLTILMFESLLFNLFGYVFELAFEEVFSLIITNYLLKVLLTIIYLPFTKYLWPLKKVNV